MPYIKETCVAGKTIEISKYYSFRWHSKGEKRNPRNRVSSDAQKRINYRNAATTLRRLMNNNFEDGDLLVRLDFSNRPEGSIDMQELMAKAIRKMRAEFKKLGREMKYIYVKEVGPRGSRHIHMLMNRCDTELLRKCWPHGGIHVDPLISGGQYANIADYFIKYSIRTEETEGMLIGKRWYASRNLKKPEITRQVISSNTFRKEAKTKKGYHIVPESVRSGFSEITGYEYFTYTLIKTDKNGGGG